MIRASADEGVSMLAGANDASRPGLKSDVIPFPPARA